MRGLRKGEARIKTVRKDIMRNPELDRMFKRLERMKGPTHLFYAAENTRQKILIRPKQIACLIALLWLFGKRITENLKLCRKDTYIKRGYLYVYFTVQKLEKVKGKKKGEAGWLRPIEKRYLKRITLKNPYIKYVLQYIEDITDPEAYLFPGRHEGRMSREHAWRIVKVLNHNTFPHFFRESLATTFAEEGATEEDLLHWFDWSRYETAHRYVKRGTALTKKWSDRKF